MAFGPSEHGVASTSASGVDDDALPVARRVAMLYGGEVAVAGHVTVLRLPSVFLGTTDRNLRPASGTLRGRLR